VVPTELGRCGPAIADLLGSFEGYLTDHRACAGLLGGIFEATSDAGALWGVAWLRCPACGMRWERRLALNGAG
jgi:hypothetical protein